MNALHGWELGAECELWDAFLCRVTDRNEHVSAWHPKGVAPLRLTRARKVWI